MYNAFRCTRATFDWQTGNVELGYAFDDALEFTERYCFPLPSQVTDAQKKTVERLLAALHISAGVSYYKAFLPKQIVVETHALSDEGRAFWETFYVRGLGEFYYRNGLSVKGDVRVVGVETARWAVLHEELRNKMKEENEGGDTLRPLIPIGGGKDSFVTAEMMRQAGIAFSVFVLGKNEKVLAAARATGAPLVQVTRELDEAFLRMVKQGEVAYNGHIPITGILSLAALISATLQGNDAVVMSNEASASFGNVTIDGVEVNHQWSKGIEFERTLQNYLARNVDGAPAYFSALRPYSELHIVQKFAGLTQYHDVFTSCNANFFLTRNTEKRWCGHCPKCAFVFVMLGAFLSEDRLVEIFGKNMFADETLIPLFASLLGADMKPFECVGEPKEVQAAFFLMHRDGKFVSTPVMEIFVRDTLPHIEHGEQFVADALAPRIDHAVPEAYATRLFV